MSDFYCGCLVTKHSWKGKYVVFFQRFLLYYQIQKVNVCDQYTSEHLQSKYDGVDKFGILICFCISSILSCSYKSHIHSINL